MDDVRRRLRAARADVDARLADLRADHVALVEASAAANLDDEHDPEGATVAFERAQLDAVTAALVRRAGEIDAALLRVDAGTYGRCAGCGRPIAAARLEARPTATRCVDCA